MNANESVRKIIEKSVTFLNLINYIYEGRDVKKERGRRKNRKREVKNIGRTNKIRR